MRVVCHCGTQVTSSNSDDRSCVKCGISCCAACAFSLEASTYCVRCAESILDAEGDSLALTHVEAPAWPVDVGYRAPSLPAARGDDSAQWLILVAKDQADLYGHLVRAFSRDDKVQILLDRRRDFSRNPPGMEERLRTHGAAVIRRHAV
jgi:hypothetical protein